MAELLESSNLTAGPAEELALINADPAALYERGKVDINFFGSMMLPDVVISPFPDFYVATFHMLMHRKDVDMGKIMRFALGLPRGHAKTTFIKILIAWLIVYDKISFAIIVCANESLAENLMEDVSSMLSTPNAEAVYGKWKENLIVDNKEMKRANYHLRPIVLVAKGAGSSLRGINIAHRRPDLIFCDDAQTRENDESEVERAKFRKWLTATLFKIIAPRGDRLIIYVGNMYSDQCILYQLKENTRWISLITGAILENGEPLWPSLHSLEDLMDSYFHDLELGEEETWFAEVMNDPISRATSLMDGELPRDPLTEYPMPDGVFITIDPAGFRTSSDDNVICVHYVIDGKPRVVDHSAGIKDPEQLIKDALTKALIHGATLIGVEDTAYQQTLLFWFKKYLEKHPMQGVHIVPLKPKNRTKEERIRLFLREVYSKNYFVAGNVLAPFIWLAMKYKIGHKKNKDDLLDCCSYGLDVRNEYWHLVANNRILKISQDDMHVVSNNTPF